MNQDCIFCKIAAHEIPADIIYEDDKVVAFLDLRPSNKGHSLVIHKTHTNDFQSTPDELLADLMPRIQKVAAAVMKATGASGFNLTVNNGQVSGQVIFHLHFHIIPRYEQDGLRSFPQSDSEKSARQTLAEEIKKNL